MTEERSLKQLSPKHQQLARFLVGGHSQTEIADLLGMHKTTVSRLIHDPLITEEIQRLQGVADNNIASCVPGISEKIAEGAHKSTEVLMTILEDTRNSPEILKLKANVALELLSRAGYGTVKQVNVRQSAITAHLTAEDIEGIKQRAAEALGAQSLCYPQCPT